MAYSVQSKKSGKTYYLHGRDQLLKGGHRQTIYYFAAKEQDGVMESVPKGYQVGENIKTGLPLLKKAANGR